MGQNPPPNPAIEPNGLQAQPGVSLSLGERLAQPSPRDTSLGARQVALRLQLETAPVHGAESLDDDGLFAEGLDDLSEPACVAAGADIDDEASGGVSGVSGHDRNDSVVWGSFHHQTPL